MYGKLHTCLACLRFCVEVEGDFGPLHESGRHHDQPGVKNCAALHDGSALFWASFICEGPEGDQ
jgi:hypothetical protein